MDKDAQVARMTSVIHEILLPLQALVIAAENLRRETHEKDIDVEFVRASSQNILDEVRRLEMMLSNFRRVIQESPENDNSTSDYSTVPVLPLISYAIGIFQKEAKTKGVIIEKPMCQSQSAPKLPMVRQDIVSTFMNLYSNAIKYSYSGSTGSERYIRTECYTTLRDDREYLVIKISNFGVGILKEEIDNQLIFQAGYRGKLSLDRNRTGSGVGLYIVKEIIEREHKGMVSVDSVKKNGGYLTTVTVMLPFQRG